MEAQVNQVPLPLRSHTILGVCEAIGEDFGFNPMFLRVPLSAIVLYSPLIAVAVYFALGAVVLTSRLLFPVRVEPREAAQAVAEKVDPASLSDSELPELAKAA